MPLFTECRPPGAHRAACRTRPGQEVFCCLITVLLLWWGSHAAAGTPLAVGVQVTMCTSRAAGQRRAEVHLLCQRAPVWDLGGGNDLKTCQEVFGVRPAVRFRARHHHVGAVLRAPAALAEQRAGG